MISFSATFQFYCEKHDSPNCTAAYWQNPPENQAFMVIIVSKNVLESVYLLCPKTKQSSIPRIDLRHLSILRSSLLLCSHGCETPSVQSSPHLARNSPHALMTCSIVIAWTWGRQVSHTYQAEDQLVFHLRCVSDVITRTCLSRLHQQGSCCPKAHYVLLFLQFWTPEFNLPVWVSLGLCFREVVNTKKMCSEYRFLYFSVCLSRAKC